MSFGLTNVLAAFMDLMNRVLRPYFDSFVVVLIDGVLVYLRSKDEHVLHLMIMIQTSRDYRLYVKFSKCESGLESVIFLSHIVSKEDIMVDLTKI